MKYALHTISRAGTSETRSLLTYFVFSSLSVHFLLLLYKMYLLFKFFIFLFTCWRSNELVLMLISKVCRHSFQQAKDLFMTTCYSYPIVLLCALSADASFFTLDFCCWWAVLSSALGHLSYGLHLSWAACQRDLQRSLNKGCIWSKRSLDILTILSFDLWK